ncbi:metallophosphoesterase [Nannocystis pusilla]|uniref:Metallophosphoesterase n=1 Tax=Nannocystis pusilla TaxID=889268 RepID=A0ABS7U5L1_9BACT|nr:metallophosphoesterase [Nannocystis pusilla]
MFQALADFIRAGNQVCLLPGNHDPNYHWPAVEAALRTAIGNPCSPHFMFVAGGEIHERGIHIEHGNQYSYDNCFDHWDRPILDAPDGPRLERPWGTLFMDLVYNDAEAAHRTLNRIYPHGMDRRARDLLGRGDATIVAFGHTHLLVDAQAPYGQKDPRRVFNTGSWVPQLNVTGLPRPSLDELDRVQYTGHELRILAIELGDPPRARLRTV